MSYYLVDFENVKSRGMEGVELLTEEDTVCIFYSNNADSMTFDLHRKLNETKARIIYHKVAVGTKNALDFQLATYLGYLICEHQKTEKPQEYYIVTKDNGFYSLLVYWKAEGVPVRIIRNLMWGKSQDVVPEEVIGDAQMPEEVAEEILEMNAAAEPADVIPEIWETTVPEIIEPEKIENDYEIKTGDRTNITFEADTVIAAVDVAAPDAEMTEGTVSGTDTETEAEAAPQEKAPGKKKNTRKKANQNGTAAKAKTENKAVTENKQKAKKAEKPEKTEEELTRAVEAVLKEKEIVPQVVKFIRQYKTKQGINNALNKEFKDTKRTSEIYSAIKPLIADKKGK